MNHPVIPDNMDLPFPYSCWMCGKYPTHTTFTDGSGTVFSIEDHRQCGVMLKSDNIKEVYEDWNYIMRSFITNLGAKHIIPDNDFKQVNDVIERLGQANYDPQTESYQGYVARANAWAKERERIFNLGIVAKKKSRFSWRRTLTFLAIYFGYCIAGYFVNKYFHYFYFAFFCWATFAGTHAVMGVKLGDYFWEEKE